jgi:hypothetical protein
MRSRRGVLPSCTLTANSKSGLGKAYQTSISQAFTGFPLVTETALRLPSSKDSRTLRPSFISTSGTATAKASGEEGQETQCLGKRLHREPRPPSLQPTNAGPEVALFVPEDAEPNPARQQLRLRSFHAWKGRQARSSPTSDTDPIPESLPRLALDMFRPDGSRQPRTLSAAPSCEIRAQPDAKSYRSTAMSLRQTKTLAHGSQMPSRLPFYTPALGPAQLLLSPTSCAKNGSGLNGQDLKPRCRPTQMRPRAP